MKIKKYVFYVVKGSDKSNRPTLTYKFEANFAQLAFKVWP